MSDPVRTRETLQDQVYKRLRDEILNATIPPGASLRVLHLAARFGTSQAPIREALRRLTDEGLAVTVPYKGTVAKEASWEEIADIYLLREELEAFAVKRILGRKKVDLSEVRSAQRRLNRAVRTGDAVSVLDADLELHHQIVELAGSPITLETWSFIIKRLRGARLSLEREYPAPLDSVVETHDVLVQSLTSDDPEAAEAIFRHHIRSALDGFAQRRLEHRGRLD
ncbi:MAG: GntR family transcriptional regulator [Microbacteriaceae bacterium]|nr:GntR family transcriptional regulator [Microbacteriaceae bacterium]